METIGQDRLIIVCFGNLRPPFHVVIHLQLMPLIVAVRKKMVPMPLVLLNFTFMDYRLHFLQAQY